MRPPQAANAYFSLDGFLQGAWPFGLVEFVWSIVAFRRWRVTRNSNRSLDSPGGQACGLPLLRQTPRVLTAIGPEKSFRLRQTIEAVANPGLCDYVLRFIGIELDLLPQVLDNGPKIIDLIAIIGSPDRLQ